MILSGDVDYKGSGVGGVSCIAPGDIGRRETIHVPAGPSSLAQINLVENAGECNADFVNKMAPPSGKISTLPLRGEEIFLSQAEQDYRSPFEL